MLAFEYATFCVLFQALSSQADPLGKALAQADAEAIEYFLEGFRLSPRNPYFDDGDDILGLHSRDILSGNIYPTVWHERDLYPRTKKNNPGLKVDIPPPKSQYIYGFGDPPIRVPPPEPVTPQPPTAPPASKNAYQKGMTEHLTQGKKKLEQSGAKSPDPKVPVAKKPTDTKMTDYFDKNGRHYGTTPPGEETQQRKPAWYTPKGADSADSLYSPRRSSKRALMKRQILIDRALRGVPIEAF